MAAIEEAVPAEVLSAALYARFRSRREHTFAEKMLSAMRKGFGGHVEPQGGRLRWTRGPTRHRPARSSSSARLATSPDAFSSPPSTISSAPGSCPNSSPYSVSPGPIRAPRPSGATSARAFASFAATEVVPDTWRWLSDRTYYLQGDFGHPGTYQSLDRALAEIDAMHRTGSNVLFYLATPPDAFATIVTRLGQAGLVREAGGSWRRVMVEKPFGTDLRSAQELNRTILSILAEPQIYRIDHYLGKETVQNIMVFRFANGIFEPLWNRDHIDHIQITVAETVGVEQRSAFYDRPARCGTWCQTISSSSWR